MNITGRFLLQSVAMTKAAIQDQDGKVRLVPSTRVEFMAIKDGDDEDSAFGRATPWGKIEMNIANPEPAKELADAWHAYVTDDDDQGSSGYPYHTQKQPVYEVTFRRIR